MNNGSVWYAWADYNGLTDDLQIRLSQSSTRPSAALIDYNVNLETILGQSRAYVGFTAATGAGWEDQDIVSWQFNANYQPIGVPDAPSTIYLLGAISACLPACRRFARKT